MSIWDNKGLLARLENERDVKRIQGERLPFDCFHLKVRGDRVYCSKGYLLGRAYDGTMSLVMALRGNSISVCNRCEEYTEDEPYLMPNSRTYEGW